MSACRARIERIDLSISQPIERHRGTAAGDHAKQNADEFLPAPRHASGNAWWKQTSPTSLASSRALAPCSTAMSDRIRPPGHQRRQERERQGKNRVAESNQFQQMSNAREHGKQRTINQFPSAR